MPSYSNRPGYGEPLPMGGDYQAIPRAPRTPHFPEPSVRGHQYNATGPFQAQYGQGFAPTSRASVRSIPSPPGSLSPVAMASARSAVATGPQQTMDAGPSRPSAKAGMSILLAGAIIGGLIGAVMHARQNAADAIAAASMREPAPMTAPASSSAAVPPLAPLASASGGVITNFPDKKDAADKKDDKTADKTADKKDDKKSKKKPAWTGGGKKAGAAETVASAEEPEAPAPKKSKKSKDDDDGYTIASADGSGGSSSTSKADKAEKAEKADKPEKKESPSKKSGGDKETKASGGEKKSSGKGGDDAVNVLKAAMGATENTL